MRVNFKRYNSTIPLCEKKWVNKRLVQLRGCLHLPGRRIGSHIVSQNALVGCFADAEAWAS